MRCDLQPNPDDIRYLIPARPLPPQVIRPFFMTDRLVVKLKEKENVLHCVYLNDFSMVIAAFILQCNEAKSWYDGINKASKIYSRLKQESDTHSIKVVPHHGLVNDSLSIKKSPLGSSIGKSAAGCVSSPNTQLKANYKAMLAFPRRWLWTCDSPLNLIVRSGLFC